MKLNKIASNELKNGNYYPQKVEILELKNISGIKNPLYGFSINRMDMVEK